MTPATGSDRGGYALVVAGASLWGTWSLFFRPAERIAPVSAAVEGVVVSAVVLTLTAPFALRLRRREARSAGAWTLLAFLGVANAFNVLLFFWAMQRTSIAIAVLTHYVSPILVALAAPVVLKETMHPRTWLSLGITLGGLVLLLEPWRAGAAGALPGAALGAGSAIFHAVLLLATRRLTEWFAPIEILAWNNVPILATLAPFVSWGEHDVAPGALGLLLAAGVVPGALGGLCFVTGMRRVTASRAAVLVLLEPLVAVIVAAIAWGEVPRAIGAAGGLLVLLGACSVLRQG